MPTDHACSARWLLFLLRLFLCNPYCSSVQTSLVLACFTCRRSVWHYFLGSCCKGVTIQGLRRSLALASWCFNGQRFSIICGFGQKRRNFRGGYVGR